MAQPVTKELGAFAAGEVPPPLVVTYLDFNENPVNLVGFTNLQVNIDEELGANQNPLGTGTITLTDAANGVLEYGWVRDDMLDIGEYTTQAWVNNGVNFFASDLYTYTVYDGPGTPPA